MEFIIYWLSVFYRPLPCIVCNFWEIRHIKKELFLGKNDIGRLFSLGRVIYHFRQKNRPKARKTLFRQNNAFTPLRVCLLAVSDSVPLSVIFQYLCTRTKPLGGASFACYNIGNVRITVTRMPRLFHVIDWFCVRFVFRVKSLRE